MMIIPTGWVKNAEEQKHKQVRFMCPYCGCMCKAIDKEYRSEWP